MKSTLIILATTLATTLTIAACGNRNTQNSQAAPVGETNTEETGQDMVETKKGNLVGAYGNQREITEEEMAMFRKAIAFDTDTYYTPLSVSTQVVAGTNYRFWSRYEILNKTAAEQQQTAQTNAPETNPEEGPNYCWITIFKPLPGRGEPQVTSIDKDYTL